MAISESEIPAVPMTELANSKYFSRPPASENVLFKWPATKTTSNPWNSSLNDPSNPAIPTYRWVGSLSLWIPQFPRYLAPTQAPPVPVFHTPGANSGSPSPSFQNWDWGSLSWRQGYWKLGLGEPELGPGILKTGTGGAWVGARDLENWDWGSLSWGQGSWKLGLGELELAPGILKTGTGGAWVGARDLENWDWGSLSWRQGGILKTGTGGAWVGARDLENWDWGSLSWGQGSWKLGLGELELAPGILKTGTGGAWVGARDLENWDWGSLSWRQGSWKLGLGELELALGILKTGTGGAWVGARDLQDPWRQPRLSQSQFSRSPGWNFWKFTKNYGQFSAKFDKQNWKMWSVDNIFQFFGQVWVHFFAGKNCLVVSSQLFLIKTSKKRGHPITFFQD